MFSFTVQICFVSVLLFAGVNPERLLHGNVTRLQWVPLQYKNQEKRKEIQNKGVKNV